MLAEHSVDAIGEHGDAVGALAVRKSRPWVVVNKPMQSKDLVAIGPSATHGRAVVVGGALAELGDRELDVGFAFGHSVIGAHEGRSGAAAHICRHLRWA